MISEYGEASAASAVAALAKQARKTNASEWVRALPACINALSLLYYWRSLSLYARDFTAVLSKQLKFSE